MQMFFILLSYADSSFNFSKYRSLLPFSCADLFPLTVYLCERFFSVWFPKEIRYVWSYCWALWSHSSLPVPFDPNKVPSYPLYQISLKLSKDTKLLQVLFLKWQWIGDTHGITSAKGKAAAAGIKQSPAQLAASTHPGAKQTSLTVHSPAGTVGQCCTEEGRKELRSRKEKLMHWEGQAVIPLSPVKLINTNLQEDKFHPSSAVYKSRWYILCSLTHLLLGLWPLPGPPSCFYNVHTHISVPLSASCPVIQFFITHQHPLDQCSGARLLVITMTQIPLALKPEKHNLDTSYRACSPCRTACCYNTASHTVKILFIPWTRPASFTVASTDLL